MRKKHYFVFALGVADYPDEVAIHINEWIAAGYQLNLVYTVASGAHISHVYGIFWKWVKCPK